MRPSDKSVNSDPKQYYYRRCFFRVPGLVNHLAVGNAMVSECLRCILYLLISYFQKLFFTWVAGIPRHSHVSGWLICHKAGPATMLSCFAVQITYFLLPPEIKTHALRIKRAYIYAVRIVWCLLCAVGRVEKGKTKLGFLFTTHTTIWNRKLTVKTEKS